MLKTSFLKKIAATMAVTGMMVTAIADFSLAAVVINNEQAVSGFVRTNAPLYRFQAQTRTGTVTRTAPGEEYNFTAQQGQNIKVSFTAEDGSALVPILVLFAPNGRQVSYTETSRSLSYQVPTTGQYRLLVLGKNNTRGRYSLSVAGLNQSTQLTADRVMREVLKLRIIGCGVPNVAKITIGTEERCTRNIEAGNYTYDAASKSIRLVSAGSPTSSQTSDQKRQFLQNEYGLRVLDSCPTVRTNLVVAYFTEYGQTTTYCANPNRALKAGEYTYNPVANDLRPGNVTSQNPTTSTPTTTVDRRRDFLQNEYGLRVLDSCPAVRTNLVVAYFTEYGQTTTYCANPNRALQAGEYTYNPVSNDLRPGTSVVQNPSNTTTDSRRTTLQNDYGLTVLDSCPAARSSYAVVTFADPNGQTYVYCANPNGRVPAGEYVYNYSSAQLETATKPQNCTVQVGGICLVK